MQEPPPHTEESEHIRSWHCSNKNTCDTAARVTEICHECHLIVTVTSPAERCGLAAVWGPWPGRWRGP